MNKLLLLGIVVLIASHLLAPKLFTYFRDNFSSYSSSSPSSYPSPSTASPLSSERVLAGLKRQTQSKPPCTHIAVGYNANLDLIVKALDVMGVLNVQPAGSQDHASVASISDFQELFSFFLSSGSAAERIVDDEAVFQQIVKAASDLPHKVFSTGGNAALMANKLATEGCDVLLGGAVGSTLSTLLHPSVKVTKNEGPEEVKDEIHLILEYPTGTQWGTHTAPRANRLILTKDETNAKLTPLEAFHKRLPGFDPSLVVVAGFHLLEGQPKEFRRQRIEKALISINTLPDASKHDSKFIAVHLELASVGSSEYLQELAEGVVPHVDSLGLNEQELGSIYIVTGGTDYTAHDFKSPSVRTVVDAIKHIFELSRKQTKVNSYGRTLSRVHFHCLHFHLIVQKRVSMWQKGLVGVAAGSLACSQQACDHEGVDVLLPRIFDVAPNRNITVEDDSPATPWREGDFEYYLAPVLVCRKPLRTVGLGDAISAVGLISHERKTQRKAKDNDEGQFS